MSALLVRVTHSLPIAYDTTTCHFVTTNRSDDMRVRQWIRAVVMIGLVIGAASGGVRGQPLAMQQTALDVRRALQRLPSYGVFDFLSFKVEEGTVTLAGFAYTDTLRAAAQRAVRRVSGVDEVANQITLLPASLNDDRIRRDAFYRIYSDSSLSRYASGGPRAVLYEAREFGRWPGRQPFGDYPIHIVVSGGRMRLLGVVDSGADKQIAGFKAREVEGVFEVHNDLEVPTSR
jgi:osmotically-inducible protein OsmY